MENLGAAQTSVFWGTDTRPGPAAAALDLAWAVMASPAKVSVTAVHVIPLLGLNDCKSTIVLSNVICLSKPFKRAQSSNGLLALLGVRGKNVEEQSSCFF